MGSLPPGFKGRLPANKEYNGPFFLAGRGVARCLIARGQHDKGREVLEQLAKLDPDEKHIRELLVQLKERGNAKLRSDSTATQGRMAWPAIRIVHNRP